MNGYIIFGICLVIVAVIRLLRLETDKFRVVRYTIPMWKMKDNKNIPGKQLGKVCRFVFLSDLHNKSYGKENERLLAAIDEADPDLILCTGDMLIARPGESMEIPIAFMQRLASKYPVYYANGNHEYRLRLYPEKYGDMYTVYKKAMLDCGIHYLENESETVSFHGRTINICGLEIDRKYYKRFRKTPMEEGYLESEVGRKPDTYTVLLAHNPDYFPQYAAWGAELTLSGHVHGGIIRLPKLGGVFSPQIRLFPTYDGGLYERDGSRMILSRGLGMHTIPVRIGNRAELIVVDMADVTV